MDFNKAPSINSDLEGVMDPVLNQSKDSSRSHSSRGRSNERNKHVKRKGMDDENYAKAHIKTIFPS